MFVKRVWIHSAVPDVEEGTLETILECLICSVLFTYIVLSHYVSVFVYTLNLKL